MTQVDTLKIKETKLIKLDGKVFATLELAVPFFTAALKIEIYNLPLVKK